MKVSIDRFEGEYAICEKDNREKLEIEKKLLPEGAKPGDILDIDGERITIDPEETKKRKEEIEGLVDDLFD